MTKGELDVFIKWVLGGLMILAAVYFFPWGDITWGRVILKNEGVVTVTGYAESDVKNQIANYSAGVNVLNDDKNTAVNEVNTKMTALVKVVKAFGVADEDIQTQQMSVYQMQEAESRPVQTTMPIDGGKVRLGQWSVSNTIQITLRDVEKAGQLADILNTSGANNVYGPNFQLDISKKAGDELLGMAVADAKKKAESIAVASGAKLGRVVSVIEGVPPAIYPMMSSSKAETAIAPAPVEVGSTKIFEIVTVVWSLR